MKIAGRTEGTIEGMIDGTIEGKNAGRSNEETVKERLRVPSPLQELFGA